MGTGCTPEPALHRLGPMRVGVFGATGQVGEVIRGLLMERDYPVEEMRYFASSRSAGRTLPWRGRDITVEDAATADFTGLDVALFSAGGATSKSLAPTVAAAGATVIDNSSAWRMDDRVPLIVAEVNPDDVERAQIGIIANPNCTTMAAMPAIKALHDVAGLNAMQITTFQAVSGSGVAGVSTLKNQLTAIDDPARLATDGSLMVPEDLGPYVAPIAYNALPMAGAMVRRSCATNRARSSTFLLCAWRAPACGCRSSADTASASTPSSIVPSHRRRLVKPCPWRLASSSWMSRRH